MKISRLFCLGLTIGLLTACGPGDHIEETGLSLAQISDALKLTGTATASSTQSSTLGPEKAVDGNTTTRWSSAFSDPQWIRVDLGSVKSINRVVLRWEAAYSSNYEIQISSDATTWTKIYGDAAGNGGVDDIALSGSARYVRMYSTKRGTAYGNSLYEFEVYAPDVTPPPPPPPSAVQLPAKIEAEAYVRFYDTTTGNSGTPSCSSTDVDAQTTTDSKGGVCNIGWTVAGEWLEYDVSASSTAAFDITVRMASNATGKTVHLELDGVNVSGPMTAPSGGWQAYGDVIARNISIASGSHKLRLVMDTGSTNVNYLDVRSASTACTPQCSGKTCGPDGCGGSCGSCGTGLTCSSAGTCQASAGSLDQCKRGVAYGQNSVADLTALAKGIGWWYNWSQLPESAVRTSYAGIPVEFVPMLWDEQFTVSSASSNMLSNQGRYPVKTLLGFNEPNFFSQANLSPEQAAAKWPEVQQVAAATGAAIASPALNYCGGGCWETDPFVYLDKFFAACPGCKVDYIAVHWYACKVDYLKNYISNIKSHSWSNNRPIWLTEFSCLDENVDDTNQAAEIAYMKAAVQYLEFEEPAVKRYAWFSGRFSTATNNVNLLDTTSGQLTNLGREYVNYPTATNCPLNK